MADILPLRFRILHYIASVDRACADDIMQALRPEYGMEKQFKKEVIVDHLFSMKANFVIDDNDVSINDKNELLIYYSINEEGSRLLKKYFPKKWR